MDFEGSISSWIHKIHEGFDTFCLEAKDILPKKLVDNVQDQLVTAAENLKQFCFDLNISADMMKEKVDSQYYEDNSVDEEDLTKCVEVVEVESSHFSTSVEVGSYDEAYDISDSEFYEDSIEGLVFKELPPEWYIPPDPAAKLIAGRLNLEELKCLHSRWIASYRFCLDSHDDDVHKCSIISDFSTSTQDYSFNEDKASKEIGSDSRFEIQKPDYSHLLGHDLRAELIKQGFLSPLSESVQSLVSEPSEETQEIDGSLDDKVTSSDDKVTCYVDDTISSRTRDSIPIPDMLECWSNPKQSPVGDAIDVVAKSNKDNAEIVEDNEWERLDDVDFSDEDWEIV